ncbi:MAG: hypothetical protein M4D80_28420 [Myxococcota bacterium]|nr:hypothetical protein [Deltaproteobacteria bacterium]MDQ3339104.1 hypothetical protein [Myxococcota bacterium]
MRFGFALLATLAASPAVADDPSSDAKFKAMDAARLAVVNALDKHDAAALGAYVAGDPKVLLDDATRAELAALPGGVAAFRVCVDKRGAVASHEMVDLDAKSAVAKAVASAVKTWQFKPFEIRGKAIPICSVAFVRAKEK